MIAAFGERTNWRFLGYVGIGLLVGLEIDTLVREHAGWALAATTMLVTLLIAAGWLPLMLMHLRDRFSPVGAVVVVGIGIGSIALVLLTPDGAAVIAAVVALAMAASRFPRRTGAVFAVVLIAGYLAATAFRVGLQPIALLSFGLGLAFSYVASSSVARLRAEEARARQLLGELQASRDAQVQAAALNERSRIAREIHDVLAHTLAALAVQLEGARLMLEKTSPESDALAAVERAHRLAREGLGEVRSAVSTLRGERIPGPDHVRELVREFEQDTDIAADFKVEGESRDLGSEGSVAIYRTAQEALTNVRKHADATRVAVVLRYDADGTELEVVDVAQPKESMKRSPGYGLVGMRERAELLGGLLEAGPTDDGFRVRLRIPE